MVVCVKLSVLVLVEVVLKLSVSLCASANVDELNADTLCVVVPQRLASPLSDTVPVSLVVILSCLPVGITGLLVVPIPNYHNVLCAIQSILRFYKERRNYIWRGWCFYGEFGNEDKNKK